MSLSDWSKRVGDVIIGMQRPPARKVMGGFGGLLKCDPVCSLRCKRLVRLSLACGIVGFLFAFIAPRNVSHHFVKICTIIACATASPMVVVLAALVNGLFEDLYRITANYNFLL